MKQFFHICILLCAALHVRAQITPIVVSPQPIPGFQQSPTKVAYIGSRIFGVFSPNFGNYVFHSDDNGITWIKSAALPGEVEDIISDGTNLVAVTYQINSPAHTFTLCLSTDNGATFTVTDTKTEYKTETGDGYTNYTDSPKLFIANGVIYFTYYSENETNGHNEKYFRGLYSLTGGASWTPCHSSTANLGSAENILYYDNKYILLCAGIDYNALNSQKSYAALNSDLSNRSPLPYGAVSPDASIASGVLNNTLFVVADDGNLWQRNNTDPAQFFTADTLPFIPQSAALLNGNFYYLAQNDIFRAPATDAAHPQPVFSGLYNHVIASGIFPAFTVLGSTINCLSPFPLRSLDDGITWQPWPVSTSFASSGKVFSAGSIIGMDNGWAMRSNNGFDFNLWKPQGLPAEGYINQQNIVAHKGILFLVAGVPDGDGFIDEYVLRSGDQGQTWEQVKTVEKTYNGRLLDNGESLLYFTISSTGLQSLLYRSDDAGTTWQQIPAPLTSSYVNYFTAMGDTIVLQRNGGIYYSHDNGGSWNISSFTGNLNDQVFSWKGTIVIGGYYGGKVYSSKDGGATFQQIAALPGSGYKYTLVGDSILLASSSSSSILYASLLGNIHWVSFGNLISWRYMHDFALSNGYLYGSQDSYYLSLSGTSPFSRIPLEEILDPLNNMPDQSGTVAGKLFYDTNFNCIQDAGELSLVDQIVRFEPGGILTSTHNDGSYGIILPPGNYQMQTDTPSYYDLSCAPALNFALANQQNVARTIGFQPNATVRDLQVTMTISPVRPGRLFYLTIQVENLGTQATPAGIPLHLLYQGNQISYQGADPTPLTVMQGELVYSLPAILPHQKLKYKITLMLEADPGLAGHLFTFLAEASNTFSDAFPGDNVFTLPIIATGSFDPNDKTAFTNVPSGNQMSYRETSLRYLVRFQNTGTDTAFRIAIRDTLSPLLNAATIRTISASHTYRFSLRNNHIAEWTFDPVELPHSAVDEPNSHGYVYFSIDKKADAPIGVSINNTAAIYFDINPPVLTNTTKTKVVRRITMREDSDTESVTGKVLTFPNPAGSKAVFELEGAHKIPLILEITDGEGRIIHTARVTEKRYEFERNGLPSGQYSWILRTDNDVTDSGILVFQ